MLGKNVLVFLVFHSIKPVDSSVYVHKKFFFLLYFYLFIYNHSIVWIFLVTEQMVVGKYLYKYFFALF